MRAVGANNAVVMRMVVAEGVLISLISYILGVFLSFPITVLLANVVSEAIFRSPANFVIGHMGFATWLVLVLVLSAVSSIIPARRASRMTIREVLAYE
jgi:putative ABC transport system permease protein